MSHWGFTISLGFIHTVTHQWQEAEILYKPLGAICGSIVQKELWIKPLSLFYLLSHSRLTKQSHSVIWTFLPKSLCFQQLSDIKFTLQSLNWDGWIRVNLNKPLTEEGEPVGLIFWLEIFPCSSHGENNIIVQTQHQIVMTVFWAVITVVQVEAQTSFD